MTTLTARESRTGTLQSAPHRLRTVGGQPIQQLAHNTTTDRARLASRRRVHRALDLGRHRVGYVRTVDFSETVTTRSHLREVLAEPSEFVTNKEFVELDEFGRDFIARSPFVLIPHGSQLQATAARWPRQNLYEERSQRRFWRWRGPSGLYDPATMAGATT